MALSSYDSTSRHVNNLEPAAASYSIVRTKQADAFPVFIQRATEHRPQSSYPTNRSNNHAAGSGDYNGHTCCHNEQSNMVATATKYISKPVSPAPGIQGDENGYLYTYQQPQPNSPSPTNSAQAEILERNIERWEKQRTTRRSVQPAATSSLIHKNRPQTISDIRSVYARSTPNIDKVSLPPPGTKKKPLDKSSYENEDVVNDLTNLMVTKMNIELEPNSYGLCTKCLRSVRFEDEGCTAQDQLYHTKCFCCNKCGKSLRGGSFYSIDGKAVCEADYMETLEKCTSCRKPITERILRATGKPYHPKCFTCVVCKQCLDGVPFTVDASNQIHCIDDFHSKFAPRCSVCREPIVPEYGTEETVRIVCMDRNFHPKCYRCEGCGLVLNSDDEGHGCYPLDGHILCHSCNVKRTNQVNTEILKNHI